MKEQKKQSKVKRFFSANGLRMLVSVCLILAVFVAPLLTEARYRAYLNSFSAVIAKEYYFSSDYLKEDGADYLVNGWTGETMTLDDIQIRNYDNTLLANQEGQDLKYKMTWDVQAYNSQDQKLAADYTLTVALKSTDEKIKNEQTGAESDSQPTVNVTEKNVVHQLTGNGQSKRDVYSLTLHAPEGVTMADGSYVVVTLTATNSDGVNEDLNQYSRTITARLRYNVSVLENFINQFNVQDKGDMITTTIATSTIPGEGASQKVYMWWDTDVLEVNRYNFQFNQLFMQGKYEEKTVTVNGAERHFALLEISATSLSLRTFEFEEKTEITLTESNIQRNVRYDHSSVTPTVYLGYYLDDTVPGTQAPGSTAVPGTTNPGGGETQE